MLVRQLFRTNILSPLVMQTRSYPRGSRNRMPVGSKIVDAGIRRQVGLAGDVQDYLDDPDGFGNGESDFMNMNKAYRDHEREVINTGTKVKRLMVKNKYFKQSGHNFLTWAEKEQIRNLYTNDPECWSIERLAESFPATIETVAKVATAKWHPKDEKRVQKHDEAVKATWTRFRSNQIDDLDAKLAEHLKKFSHRSFNNTANNVNLKAMAENKFQFPKPTRNEFASIITNCKKRPDKGVPVADKQETQQMAISDGLKGMPANDEDSFLLRPVRGNHHYQFTDIVKKKQMQPMRPNRDEAKSMNPFQGDKSSDTNNVITLNAEDLMMPETGVKKFQSPGVVQSQERLQPMTAANLVRDRVRIPKKLRRHGATYQFNDCFYDSDGWLLYRVPGLLINRN